ncbi:hypothetical protein HHI36_006300 [Cryptolaemus montrouzieri]|uniref:Uncharacterized protein n=1 Tax=Cryptolaemus montrouzieri TaxID=559131 RepID=A0ABD2NWP6_9CUCU
MDNGPHTVNKEELRRITQEAVTRYTDTSWRIYRQNKKSNLKKSKSNNKPSQKNELSFADPTNETTNENDSPNGDTYSQLSKSTKSQNLSGSKNEPNDEECNNSDISNGNFNNYAEVRTAKTYIDK